MKSHRFFLRFWPLAVIILTLPVSLAAYFLSAAPDRGVYGVAEEGSVRETVFVQGLFLYDETVVKATEAGTFSSSRTDGTAVAAGEECGVLKRLNNLYGDPLETLKAPREGLFFRRTDGWESFFNRDMIASLDGGDIFDLYTETSEEPASFLRAGDDCFKIVDNKKDVFFYADIGAMNVKRAEKVRLSIGKEELSGKVEALYGKEGRRFALVRLAPTAVCYERRFAEAGWLIDSFSGTVIEAAALKKRWGDIGVYCEEEGKLHFRKVDVLCSDGKKCVISGINPGEIVFFGKR